MTNKEELAAKFNGLLISAFTEKVKQEAAAAKQNGLLIIYAEGQDKLWFSGAAAREFNATDGTAIRITTKGVILDQREDPCGTQQKSECIFYQQWLEAQKIIEIDVAKNAWWQITAPGFPAAKFKIYSDLTEPKQIFCEGIVLDFNDYK